MQPVDQSVAPMKFSVGGASFLAVLSVLGTVLTSRTWLEWVLAGALVMTWVVLIVHLARRQKNLPSARWGLALKLLFALVFALLCASAVTHFAQK
jgi:peptidoglycan biosynthesis protein MviN/MurJ (putative lipid II flippase)